MTVQVVPDAQLVEPVQVRPMIQHESAQIRVTIDSELTTALAVLGNNSASRSCGGTRGSGLAGGRAGSGSSRATPHFVHSRPGNGVRGVAAVKIEQDTGVTV